MDSPDAIYESWNPDSNTWNPSKQCIVDAYSDCIVYFDLEEAWDAATAMDDHGAGDQSVFLLSDFANLRFNDFIGNENGEESTSTE
jgi:hypothetical protein